MLTLFIKDMYVEYKVEFPASFTPEQNECKNTKLNLFLKYIFSVEDVFQG